MKESQNSKFKSQKFGRKEQKMLVIFFLSFLVLSSLFLVAPVGASTGINKTINFQGKLTNSDGTNVSDNTYSVVFTLYNASSGGTNLWTETQSVTTSNGIFQVALGSVNSLASVNFNSDALYLGIKVGSDSEMTPRIRFSAVPYALNADKLNGVTATQSATGFNLQGGSSSLSTVSFTTSGNTLTLQPGLTGGLTIQSNGANGLTLDTGGAGALNIGTTNATSAVLGSSTLGSFTVTTNGTGDSEVVLPAQSIGSSEIVNDGLDFAQLADSESLDANTTVSFGGNDYSYNLNSTGDFVIQDAGNTFAQFIHGGTVTLGKSASADTINIGTGTGTDTINFGTDNTVGDTLTIGNDNASTVLSLLGGAVSISGDSLALSSENLSLTGDSSWSVNSAGTAMFANLSGAGLTNCSGSTDKLLWSSTGLFSCGSDNNTAAVFDVYDNSGGQTVNGTPIVVNLDTIRRDDTNFSLSSDVVTVNGDGTYAISFTGGAANATGTRGDVEFYLQLNTGSGFSQVAGSQCYIYDRSTTNSATCSKTVVLDLTSGDQVEIQAVVSTGSSTATTLAGDSSLTLNRVIGGSSGGSGISGVGIRTTDGTQTVSGATTVEFGSSSSSNDQFMITDAGGGIGKVTLGNQVPLLNTASIVTGGWIFNTTQTTFSSLMHANAGIDTSTTNQNLVLSANGSGHLILSADNDSFVGVGTTTPKVTLDVRGQVGTAPAASVSAQSSFASFLIDNAGSGDILTASKSGAAKFTILNSGNLQLNNYTSPNGILYTDGSGILQQLSEGISSQCLAMNGMGDGLTWSACGGAGGSSQWTVSNGAISPNFASTVDLLLGGTSTGSAKFAVTHIDSGIPTASISAIATGSSLAFDANGNITTTQGQSLTLGGGDSGNVIIGSTLMLDPSLGINGGGLSDCSGATTSKLLWDASTNRFSCGTDQGGGGGGSLTVQESDSSPSVPAVATLQFGPATTSSDQFTITDQGGGVARVMLGNQVPLLNAGSVVTGGWTFNTVQTTFSTLVHANSGIDTSTTNQDLTFSTNGSGYFVVNTDANSGLYLGSSANKPAVLSISGGIGSNALAIFNQTNAGDILTASAAGITKFVIKNDGTASSSAGFTLDNAGSVQTTKAQTLTIGGTGTGNIVFSPNGSSTGLTLSSNGANISLATSSTGGLTLDSGSGGINIGDDTVAKAIEIGGVDSDATDTIRISTNATSPDTITIGNANAGTTTSITGGTAWSVDTGGNATFSSISGAGLTACSSTQKLQWSSGTFSCGTDGTLDTVTVDTFTSNGTWSLPANTKFAQVIVTGAGGGGGEATGTDTSNDNAAGGGGAGSTSIKMISVASLGSSQTVTVGTGGAGGTGGNGNTGNSGNSSSFGSLVSAAGGSGGPGAKGAATFNGSAGGAGASAGSSGDVNIAGGEGHNGVGGNGDAEGGGGGVSYWGGGGSGGHQTTNGATAGGNGVAYGSGGGGASDISVSASADGGQGANGVVVVMSYRSTGADLAEWYETKSDVTEGDIVAVSSDSYGYNSKLGLQQSSVLAKATQGSTMVGVVSSVPYQTMGTDIFSVAQHPKPIALAGRVPVLVSEENGKIKAGDLLTVSTTPGVAMKATKAGITIGTALEDSNCQGVSTCKVLVMVNTTYSNGSLLKNVLASNGLTLDAIPQGVDLGRMIFAQMIQDKKDIRDVKNISEVATDIVTAGLEIITPQVVSNEIDVNTIKSASGSALTMQLENSGTFVIKNATGEAKATVDSNGDAYFSGNVHAAGIGSFAQAVVGNIQIGSGIAQNMLIDGYLNVKDNITAGILTVGDITTNSLTVTTENISIGRQTLRDYIASVVIDVLNQQAQNQQTNNTTAVAGLELVESGIKNQEARVNDLEAVLASSSAVLGASTIATESAEAHDTHVPAALSLDSLTVDGLATVSSTLRVKQNSLIEGMLTVIDTVMTKNLVVSGLATFLSDVVFTGPVSFSTPPTFSKDTAGFAIIKKDSDRVDVVFGKPYQNTPSVNVSISLESGITNQESGEDELKQEKKLEDSILASDIAYIVTKKTSKGFTILLNKPAVEDLPFSWTALVVDDPQTFESKQTYNLLSPTSTIQVPSPSPAGGLGLNEGDPPSLEASEGREEVIDHEGTH